MHILEETINESEKSAMEWLIHAAKKMKFNGFPHSRWLYLPEIFAWRSSYPETSGYLIENLIERNIWHHELQLTIAQKTANWLLEQQSPSGYFYAGLKKHKPSIFNTAQIIGGLHLFQKRKQVEKYNECIFNAHNWFIRQINKEGIWQAGLYVDSWFSVYYAHALWKYLEIDLHYFNGNNLDLLTKSYTHLLGKAQIALSANSSFYPNKPCLSHTLAYALQGLLECAKILKDGQRIQWVYDSLKNINERSLVRQQFPAEFHNETSWNATYICTTGHAQFASLYYQLYADLQEPWALETAEQLMFDLINIQYKNHKPGINGAFPASYPVWKPYFPFRIVNWTQKFFLDACWRRRMVVGRC